jgi:hypothetical protein
MVGATTRFLSQHVEGWSLRCGDRCAVSSRDGSHDETLLPLNVCISFSQGPQTQSRLVRRSNTQETQHRRANYRRRLHKRAARQPNPAARIVNAVAQRDIDLAIVWGPLAGYFAKQSRVPLEVVPVSPQIDQPFLPFVFDISMGVRRDDQDLKDQIEQILENRRAEIDRILADYRVPRVDQEKGGSGV